MTLNINSDLEDRIAKEQRDALDFEKERERKFNEAADQLFYYLANTFVERMSSSDVLARWEQSKLPFRALLKDAIEALR